MAYRIGADIVVIVHFLWIVFMILGFAFTVCAVFAVYVFRSERGIWRRFFDRWLLRSIHLGGMVYVGVLILLDKYCPLTILENNFRRQYDPSAVYPGSFMVHYFRKLVFPDVDPMLIIVPTLAVGVLTLAAYILIPPREIRGLLSRGHIGPHR